MHPSTKVRVSGVVTRKVLNAGSKSEHVGFVLAAENGQPELKLMLRNGSPFYEPAFEQFEGKRIIVTCGEGTHIPRIMIDSINDIQIVTPSTKQKPSAPRM